MNDDEVKSKPLTKTSENKDQSYTMNINIAKLKESQKKREDFFKKHPDLLSEQIEQKRKEREQAKKAIIKKINSDNKPLSKTKVTPSKPITSLKDNEKSVVKRPQTDDVKKSPEIRVIKSRASNKDKKTTTTNTVGEKQQRLSYTLQMDQVSNSHVEAYRKKKRKDNYFNFEDRFESLNPKINRYYTIVIIILLVLISITLILLNIK
ncbi:hypothetical protein [Mycoplasma sp. P36-A1]|uniref:hypothetical protein n=1 Tax=Mycoplasma sp. P36-A1 TaxID=3252900 RepID=UPI003C2F188C